jgi:hypothetical protein
MTPEGGQLMWHLLEVAIGIGAVLVLLLVVKTRLEYRRRTYDPTLIFEFQKTFDSLEDERCQAARVCMAFLDAPQDSRNWRAVPKKKQEKVEPVLDFLEDLGFYLCGDQLSDEVTHHHFFHWIRGWYSNLESYIEYYRNVRHEAAAYENIKSLHHRVSRIEKLYDKPRLWLQTDQEKREFLNEECDDSEDDKGDP